MAVLRFARIVHLQLCNSDPDSSTKGLVDRYHLHSEPTDDHANVGMRL